MWGTVLAAMARMTLLLTVYLELIPLIQKWHSTVCDAAAAAFELSSQANTFPPTCTQPFPPRPRHITKQRKAALVSQLAALVQLIKC
jgi:hypothetical protein